MINFTGVRLSKYNTELELPVDTTDLDDLKDAEWVSKIKFSIVVYPIVFSFSLPEFYRTDYYGMFLVAIIDMGCSSVSLVILNIT